MAKTTVGTAHRHKTKAGYWSDKTDADSGSGHTHDYLDTPHAADILTAVEVTALKAILAAGGGGGTTPPAPPADTSPPVIANPNTTAITQTSALVSWSQNEPGTGQVQYGTTTAYGSTTTLEATPMLSHSQVVSGLTANTLYHYRAKSLDPTGNIGYSIDRTFTTQPATTPATVPGVPTNLRATPGTTVVDLAWTAPTSNGGSAITGYRVYRNGVSVATPGNVLVYQDTGRTNGVSYAYTVAAINTVGEGAQSGSVSATPASPAPPQPCGSSLQAAVDAAQAGSTLNLTGCSYAAQTVTINKALTVKGLILTSTAGQRAVYVTANDVTLENCDIRGPQFATYDGNENGIETISSGVARLTVKNSRVSSFGGIGIRAYKVTDLVVSGTTVEDIVYAGIMGLSLVRGSITSNFVRRIGVFGAGANSNNAYGIAASNQAPTDALSADTMIASNVIEDVPTWHGLDTHGGARITFLNNIVRRCRHGVFVTGGTATGQATPGRSQNVITDGNTVIAPAGADQYAFVYVYSTGGTVTRNTATGWPANQELLTTSAGDPNATAVGLTVAGDNSWT